jgi:hypothetical protein
MKKAILALFIAGSLVACNSSESAQASKDSLTNAADSAKSAIDSSADAQKTAIDSTVDAAKDSVNATDTSKSKM